MSMTVPTTILWSTQGGRAKACARRTSRILRDYRYLHHSSMRQQCASTAAASTSATAATYDDGALDDYYYGTSFDDFGAHQFLNLGLFGSTANSNGHEDECENENENEHNHGMTMKMKRKKRLILMFVSTTGDAEHCDCIQETWKVLLQKSIPPHQFSNVSIALFSLGDRAYGPGAFCAAGRKLAARMVQLGAELFCNVGYGDDGTPNGGVFYDLDQWIETELMPKVLGSRSANQLSKNSSAMATTMSRRPESPYQVLIHDVDRGRGRGGSGAGPISLDNSFAHPIKEEWQMEQYRSQYNDFFSSLCPATSYRYDPKSGYRVHGSSSSTTKATKEENSAKNNSNSCRNGNNPAANPLIGHVVSNRRLTNKDWVQETRHLQIHVVTKTESSKATTPITATATTAATTTTNTPPLPYRAGDIATIIPSNPKSIVEKFLSCLPKSIQRLADVPLSITTKIIHSTQYRTNFTPWPQHCTLRGLLTFCADVASLPEREDLRSLSYFCHPSHPMGVEQRKKLVALSEVSTSDAALYGDYVIREKRNWADILFDFDSIRFDHDDNDNDDSGNNDGGYGANDISSSSSSFTPLTIEHLLMTLSPIMPRHFSIASAPSTSIVNGHPSGYAESIMETCGFDLELCVAVVKGKTPHGRMYHGLCSKYLSQRGRFSASVGVDDKIQSIVRIWIRPGSFGKLPLDLKSNPSVGRLGKPVRNNSTNLNTMFATPIMCVGAGTGIAPLRSLIHEREAIRQISSLQSKSTDYVEGNGNELNLTTTSDVILVFGCRKESEDYYYRDEWISLPTTCTNATTTTITKEKTFPFLRVLTAFSQDQKAKIYVQRIIREADEGLLVARHILEDGGAVYVAGGAKMARAVKDEIIDSLARHLPNGSTDAKKLLQKLQRSGRFSIEAWS